MSSIKKQQQIIVSGHAIGIKTKPGSMDFISLTDIAKVKNKDANSVIQNWIRRREAIALLNKWEEKHNEDYQPQACEELLAGVGSSSFFLSPKQWIERTGAIGIEAKSGRYGGTYGHLEIANSFLFWVSPAFKLKFILAYQQFKQENQTLDYIGWTPPEAPTALQSMHQPSTVYGVLPKIIPWVEEYENLSEDDVINMALLGVTQAQFELENPYHITKPHEGTELPQIITHWYMVQYNELYISRGIPKQERFEILNKYALESVNAMHEKRPMNEMSFLPVFEDDDFEQEQELEQ